MKQVSDILLKLKNTPENFIAVKVSQHYEKWQTLTKDRYILDIVKFGYQIEFVSEPCELCNRVPINFKGKEQSIISILIDKFIEKGIIIEDQHEPGEILSHIFIRPKQDGSYRVILNLSRLNDHVDKTTFKMETLKSA